MNPAPVRSRSSLTSSAVMSAMPVRSPVVAAARSGPAVVVSWWCGRRRAGAVETASAGRGRLVRLLGRFAGELGGDLLRRGLGGGSATAASARATRSPGRRSSSSASGSKVSAAPPARAATSSSSPGTSSSASGIAIASILGLLALRAERSRAPSMAASATSVHSRRMARMASSLAGMMKSSSSGSTLVSPVPTTGISSLLASVTAMCSRCGSTMKRRPAGGSSCACRRACPGAWSSPRSASRLPSWSGGRSRRSPGAPRAARAGRCAS